MINWCSWVTYRRWNTRVGPRLKQVKNLTLSNLSFCFLDQKIRGRWSTFISNKPIPRPVTNPYRRIGRWRILSNSKHWLLTTNSKSCHFEWPEFHRKCSKETQHFEAVKWKTRTESNKIKNEQQPPPTEKMTTAQQPRNETNETNFATTRAR